MTVTVYRFFQSPLNCFSFLNSQRPVNHYQALHIQTKKKLERKTNRVCTIVGNNQTLTHVTTN